LTMPTFWASAGAAAASAMASIAANNITFLIDYLLDFRSSYLPHFFIPGPQRKHHLQYS
jgi:hypothetical protein